MFLKVWSFITLIFTALLLGTTFGHTLEMPMKLSMDGSLWTTLQNSLYRYFAIIGAPIELGSILTSSLLAFFERAQRPTFYLTLAGAICFALAFVVWIAFTNPVNVQVAQWQINSIPADWPRWRTQWEYSHAVRFALHLIGFSLLLYSVLLEIPKSRIP